MSLFSVSHVRTRTANNHLSEIKRKEEKERGGEKEGEREREKLLALTITEKQRKRFVKSSEIGNTFLKCSFDLQNSDITIEPLV